MPYLPFEKEHWTREQAVQYFEKMGWTDRAELMRSRPRREIMMYRMGGLCEYFYGAMLPSTGWVKTFSLKPHFPGMVLMMPSRRPEPVGQIPPSYQVFAGLRPVAGMVPYFGGQ